MCGSVSNSHCLTRRGDGRAYSRELSLLLFFTIQNLMQKEDLGKLGFGEKPEGKEEAKEDKTRYVLRGGLQERISGQAMAHARFLLCIFINRDEKVYDRKREAEGFVGGTGVKGSRKGYFS